MSGGAVQPGYYCFAGSSTPTGICIYTPSLIHCNLSLHPLVHLPSNMGGCICWRLLCSPQCVWSTLCGLPCSWCTHGGGASLHGGMLRSHPLVLFKLQPVHMLPHHWSSRTETCSSLPHPLVHSYWNVCMCSHVLFRVPRLLASFFLSKLVQHWSRQHSPDCEA